MRSEVVLARLNWKDEAETRKNGVLSMRSGANSETIGWAPFFVITAYNSNKNSSWGTTSLAIIQFKEDMIFVTHRHMRAFILQ